MLLARKEPIKEAPERDRQGRAGGVKESSGGSGGGGSQSLQNTSAEMTNERFPPAGKSDTAALRSNYVAWR